MSAGGVDTATGEQQIANETVAKVALETGNAPEAGNEAEAELREREASHFIGNDDVADESKFESAAETNAMNCGDGDEGSFVEPIQHSVNALEEVADTFGAGIFLQIAA